ncbi:MAG: sulfite exporter TauE/SafE family protein [Clostridia bacterium]|nr:sulfite exporter TauE/SafE family protein [Clostridia bacterium]
MHSIHALFNQAFEYNLLLGALIMFFLGFAMSFNPCMLGMASSVVGLSRTVPKRGVQVTMGVVLTLAFVLTLMVSGVLLAFFGKAFLQVAGLGEKFIGVVFGILALYLLGLRPGVGSFLRSPLKIFGFYANSRWSAERVLYLRGAGLGAVFGIIPMPCTTPAVLAIITYMTAKEEVFSGLTLLLAYALGTGMIFVLSGFVADKLDRVSVGRWSPLVDKFFGVVLLAAAGYFLFK